MSKVKCLLAALTAVGVTSLVPAAHADWHSIVGDAVSPLSPGLANRCFTQYNGYLANSNCSDQNAALAQWPLILDSAGNGKVIKVRTMGRAVNCFVDVVDPRGDLRRTYFNTDPNGANYQEIQASFNVPDQNLARLGCFISLNNYVTGYLNN